MDQRPSFQESVLTMILTKLVPMLEFQDLISLYESSSRFQRKMNYPSMVCIMMSLHVPRQSRLLLGGRRSFNPCTLNFTEDHLDKYFNFDYFKNYVHRLCHVVPGGPSSPPSSVWRSRELYLSGYHSTSMNFPRDDTMCYHQQYLKGGFDGRLKHDTIVHRVNTVIVTKLNTPKPFSDCIILSIANPQSIRVYKCLDEEPPLDCQVLMEMNYGRVITRMTQSKSGNRILMMDTTAHLSILTFEHDSSVTITTMMVRLHDQRSWNEFPFFDADTIVTCNNENIQCFTLKDDFLTISDTFTYDHVTRGTSLEITHVIAGYNEERQFLIFPEPCLRHPIHRHQIVIRNRLEEQNVHR